MGGAQLVNARVRAAMPIRSEPPIQRAQFLREVEVEIDLGMSPVCGFSGFGAIVECWSEFFAEKKD